MSIRHLWIRIIGDENKIYRRYNKQKDKDKWCSRYIWSISGRLYLNLVSRYKVEWEIWLVPKKSWPKKWNIWNKTLDDIEKKVINLANNNIYNWPITLSLKLKEIYDIDLNQSTAYRILRRNNVRYKGKWGWKRKRKTLYVMDTPWREIQLDTCFPFWRNLKRDPIWCNWWL